LFRVLNNLVGIANGTHDPIGPMSRDLAAQAEQSTLFGAQLSSTFLNSDDIAVKILTVILIILMSASTFTTQRQLMMKNMPAAALDNPFAQQQKILLYLLPLIFAVSGVNFPIGVLIYWLTTNVWSMGQQFYVIRRMPAPGSLAEKALQERRRKRGKPLPAAMDEDAEAEAPDVPRGQRTQPKRKDRKRAQPKAGQAKAAQPKASQPTTGQPKTGQAKAAPPKTSQRKPGGTAPRT
jgi:YidC/Oxa1 family membrane protein insertase